MSKDRLRKMLVAMGRARPNRGQLAPPASHFGQTPTLSHSSEDKKPRNTDIPDQNHSYFSNFFGIPLPPERKQLQKTGLLRAVDFTGLPYPSEPPLM